MASTGEPYGLFWNSDGGDRTYDANSFEYWLKKFFTSGVFEGDLQVQASSGMTLVVGSGYANVDGKVKFWNAEFNLTLSPANSTYPRIDTVVITRDNVNRQITCEVVTGAYSGDTPQPTAPVRTAEIYQLVLAQIYVGNGVTEITQANITDTRPDTSLCGYIAGTVTEMDFSQFTAQFESYFAQFKSQHEHDWSVWEQTQVAAYAAWFDNVKAEQIADKADWDAWYAALQEELHNLPADSAEYLQIQIDEIRENGTTGSIFHVTTTNTELEGKILTVSCGTEVRTATFDSNLECTVIGFKSVGAVTFTSTDGIQTATKVLNIDYYSKYEVPIAFWSATVNIQGDDNLKGATVTVKDSDNTTVATIVLNVITGQGVFSAQKADTYTFNYTFSGTDYSESLVVDEETTYSISLSAGFSWQTWVDTASQLDSSDYADLSEVLADEKALRELFLEHACVDYMAEATSSNEDLETIINDDYCAKRINLSDYALDFLGANTVIKALMDTADKYGYGEWVITDDSTTPPTWGPKGNVPVMTGNTAPYGTASAYQVFDGNASTTASGTDFSYKFVNPICPKDFYCNVSGGTLQASNDGSTWSEPTSGSYYFYLRLHFASSVSPHTIQFYGRELKVSVPTMTSNTAPFGTANGTSIYANSVSDYDYFHAFRGLALSVSKRGWLPTLADSQNNGKVYYHFTKPVAVKVARLCYLQSSSANPPTGHFVGSHDGITWTTISETKTATTSMIIYTYEMLDNADAYEYVGFELTQEWNGAASGAYGLAMEIYGLDYSEKEFEVGTTKKWLYDHGVEVTDLGSPIISGSAIAEKQDSQLYGKLVTSGTNSYAFAPSSAIDLSSYSLMRAKVGNQLYASTNNDYPLQMMIKASRSFSNSDYTTIAIDRKQTPITNPYTASSLDISSITSTAYPMFADSTSGADRIATISEWWLE